MGDVDISVVIVNWNSRDVLLDALRSLKNNPPTGSWEAVVVDNASVDESVERVKAEAPWARVIANPTNRGLAAANNQGIHATTGEWIVLCNPDVVFASGAIDALIEVLVRHPSGAFAIPRLRHTDGSLQPSAGDLPTLAEALLGRRARRKTSSVTSGFWWYDWTHDEERSIGHGAEACYLVRRRAVADIGPQDERFPLDWEGIEWSARAHRRGWEVWFCPTAEIVHLGGVSIRQVPLRWIVSSHRGMYRYFAAQTNVAARVPLVLAIGTRALIKLGAALAGVKLYDDAHVSAGTG